MDLNHRVVAQVEGLVKKVTCLTCHSEHQYRQRDAVVASKPKLKSTSKVSRVVAENKVRTPLWGDLKNRMIPESAVNFSMSHRFKRHDCVDHPTFGLGFVQTSAERTMEVLFEQGVKILAHNR
jgi:hypothetical protein